MKMKLIVAGLSLAAVQAMAQGGPGPMCKDKDAPAGCMMMSAEEIKAHQEKMRGMKDRKSCMDYMDGHHKAMQERAAKKGEQFAGKADHRHCMGMRGEAKADKTDKADKK
jgi:hypothetical protein